MLWRFLQIWLFFWNDRPFYWADLYTNTTVYTGGKVNPVPVSTFDVLPDQGECRTGHRRNRQCLRRYRYNRVRHSFSVQMF